MSSMNHYRRPRKTPRSAPSPLSCWGFLDRLFGSPDRFRRLMLLIVLITLTTSPPENFTVLPQPGSTLQVPSSLGEVAVAPPADSDRPARSARGLRARTLLDKRLTRFDIAA
ncbi:hypothetical protein ACIBJI_39995 [Nocardia sp. NPDC050408]|uniref:hypothetical protein n=1 Tax=Nocardia sp. NPDC050408 TaxID=3364319 RepID=UPI0037A4F6EB